MYKDEVYDYAIRTGDSMRGNIKKISPDNKIDVALHVKSYQSIEPDADKILDELIRNEYLNCFVIKHECLNSFFHWNDRLVA